MSQKICKLPDYVRLNDPIFRSSLKLEPNGPLVDAIVEEELARDVALAMLRLCEDEALAFKVTRIPHGGENGFFEIVAIDAGYGASVIVYVGGDWRAENLSELELYAFRTQSKSTNYEAWRMEMAQNRAARIKLQLNRGVPSHEVNLL